MLTTAAARFRAMMPDQTVRGRHNKVRHGGFAVDASLIAADANKQRSAPSDQWPIAGLGADAGRAVREYLATLDDAAFGAASEVRPKFISPSDPAAQWTGAHKGHAFFAYATNYLIDTVNAVILDVEASRAIRQAEVGASRTMIDRRSNSSGRREHHRYRVRLSRCASLTTSASAKVICRPAEAFALCWWQRRHRIPNGTMAFHNHFDDGILVLESPALLLHKLGCSDAIEYRVANLPVIVSCPVSDTVDIGKTGKEITGKALRRRIIVASADIGRHPMMDQALVEDPCQPQLAPTGEHRPAPLLNERAPDDPLRAAQHRLNERAR
jgi:hypothetical protein